MLKHTKLLVLISAFALFVSSAYSESQDPPLNSNYKIINSNVVVLDYEDFGPPSMSFEFLGQSWWSWENSGSSDPNEKYAVKVVVYRKLTLESIKLEYPIVPKLNQDYRYVQFQKAKIYLENNIQANLIPFVTLTLKQTRRLLDTILVE